MLKNALLNSANSIITNGMNKERFDASNFDSYLISYIKHRLTNFDLRSQIYGIFCKTGFYRNNITQIEAQRMEVVHNFVEFKKGEIWIEIKEALENKGIVPTKEDNYLINKKIDRMKELMNSCIKNQEVPVKIEICPSFCSLNL